MGREEALRWAPNGREFAYRVGGCLARDELYAFTAETGAGRGIAEGPNLGVWTFDGPPLWGRAGEYVYFLRRGAVWRAARALTQVLEEDKVYNDAFGPVVAPDGKALAFVAEGARHRGWSESTQGRMGGSPWEVRERYLKNSPIFHLNRVETPLPIVHGTNDDDVPSFLADEVFVGLRRLGKTVTYAKYRGEEHAESYWSYANQVDLIHRVIAWFDRHLKGASQGAAVQGRR